MKKTNILLSALFSLSLVSIGFCDMTMKNATLKNASLQGIYILDKVTAPTAGYALSKIKSNYTGKCLRVRRDRDNTESDIGFANNLLDTSSLIAFVGTSQNLILRSNDFVTTSFAWDTQQVTMSTVSVTDPFGGAVSTLFSPTGASARLYRQVGGTWYASQIFTFSCYMKQGTARYGYIINSLNGTPFPKYGVLIDLQTGLFVTDRNSGTPLTNTSYSIQDVGNGWYRLMVSGKFAAGSYGSIYIQCASTSAITVDSGIAINNATIGEGIYIYGAQVNNQQVDLSYQATNTTVIDSRGFLSKWYDQSLNGKDYVQATAASQPCIMYCSSVIYFNGVPAIMFLKNNTMTTTYSTYTAPFTFATKVGKDLVGTSNDQLLYLQNNVSSPNGYYELEEWNATGCYGSTVASVEDWSSGKASTPINVLHNVLWDCPVNKKLNLYVNNAFITTHTFASGTTYIPLQMTTSTGVGTTIVNNYFRSHIVYNRTLTNQERTLLYQNM